MNKSILNLSTTLARTPLEPIIEEIAEEESKISQILGRATMVWPDWDIPTVGFLCWSGEVHINGIEGFWGLSKTNMHTYKGVRNKNWKYYLKEMKFRSNYRNLDFDEQVDKIIEILMGESE
ncbi:MAG: transposase [Candidatus Bipolaricaulota bacterium]